MFLNQSVIAGIYASSTFAFLPTSLPNLGLWLDASDSSTLFQSFNGTTPAISQNDPIGYWGDKSGNARNFTITNNTQFNLRRPLLKLATQNGRNTVFFDGVNDVLVRNSFMYNAGAVTIFIASRTYASIITPTNRALIGESSSSIALDRYCPIFSRNSLSPADTAKLTAFINIGSTQLSPLNQYGVAFNQGVFNIITAIDSGSSYTGFVNGVNGGTVAYTRPPSASFTLAGLGSQITSTGAPSGEMESNMCEVIVYTRALTTSERQTVEGYLQTKWGIN